MFRNKDGGAHIHITGVLLALAVIYIFIDFTQRPNTTRSFGSSDTYLVQLLSNESVNTNYSSDIDTIIDSAINIQTRLLQVKGKAVKLAIQDLSEGERKSVLLSFKRDIQAQEKDVERFIQLYQSGRWTLLKRKDQRAAIDALVKSISSQQQELIKFLNRLHDKEK